MLLVGSLLAGIGFLMKFVLIPGKERFAVYGRNVDLFFLGFDRHEWGTLHLWLAFALIALMAVHIASSGLNCRNGPHHDLGQEAHIIAAIFVVLCLFVRCFHL